uniref:Uncharacterized protein n=1 Tax=Panagrolaimus superbus TaxID=310955 RepID=A0A914Z0V4_9BILA
MKVLINDKVDYYQKLENSEFTVKWLLESLKKNDKKYLKLYGNRGVKEVITKDISDGKGLFSIICRATIIFTDSVDESDTYSTILKIPGFSGLEKSLQQCGSDKWFDESYKQKLTYLHDIECDFYTSVSSIIDIPIPKIYNTVEWIYEKQEGCIHMEDLTNLGKTISYFDNINLTQVKCFIQHLAHWHKNILCTDPKLWKGKYSKKSTNFNRGNIPFQKLGESFAQNLPSKGK